MKRNVALSVNGFGEKEESFLWASIIRSKFGIGTNGWDANHRLLCSYANPWESII